MTQENKRHPAYKETLYEHLLDHEFSQGLLSDALEEGDFKTFLLCLRDIIRAQGSIKSFAEKYKVSRTTLYSLFSDKGNPEFKTIQVILEALGLKLQIAESKPKQTSNRRSKSIRNSIRARRGARKVH